MIDADPNRMVVVQGDGCPGRPGGPHWMHFVTKHGREPKPPGRVAMWEHEVAYVVYASKYGRSQSAERLLERGGFSYGEFVMFLGHPPTTWVPR
mgnify:CR=1 FL=1